MKRRRHTSEQIVRKLREADRLLAEGMEVRPGSASSRAAPHFGRSEYQTSHNRRCAKLQNGFSVQAVAGVRRG